MDKITEYVNTLSVEERSVIISEYEQFEKDGSIGDCTLRYHAERLQETMDPTGNGSTVLWMRELLFATLRVEYKRLT